MQPPPPTHIRLNGNQKKSRRHQRGFTLVEAVISALLLGFLALTATWFWVDGLALVRTVNNDSAAIADSRAILERLAREVREVKRDNGSYCISTMTATQIVFNKHAGATPGAGCGGAGTSADVNTPAATNSDFTVTISHANTTLSLGYKGALATPQVLAAPLSDRATAFNLAYRRSDYVTAATAPAEVAYVLMTLTVAPAEGQRTTAQTVVSLRNN